VPLGVRIGVTQVTLNTSQMPAHTHSYLPPFADVDLELAGVPDVAAARIGAPATTGSTGSGQPHANMPPVIGVTWGIYAGR
jgi:microcystin-dependent protein